LLPVVGWRVLFLTGGVCPTRGGGDPLATVAGVSAFSRARSIALAGAGSAAGANGTYRRRASDVHRLDGASSRARVDPRSVSDAIFASTRSRSGRRSFVVSSPSTPDSAG
jgi:hypothetical protein